MPGELLFVEKIVQKIAEKIMEMLQKKLGKKFCKKLWQNCAKILEKNVKYFVEQFWKQLENFTIFG